MSIKKKIVWLGYDFDTAVGINNEGALVFSYNLEDIDHIQGGANVFNGQDSVMWNNLRDAFGDELRSMYQTLRSQGKLSYSNVEQAFEEHQSKWPEALFNEDSWFKYLQPLVEDGDGSYLDMLQGSKAEQRKWWLYNRFRYIDSKYNAGDALSDYIVLRGYAKSNISITPYADIYPTVKFGSATVKERGTRLTTTTLICPLDTLNDTEIMIYSSSQLASVGDLSGLKVGFANFAMATRLQSIKIGDSDSNYENINLSSLTLGNNVLLKTLDVRNCSGLGDTTIEGHTQTSVDLSNCSIIENIYFDGTKIQGITLPNGGNVKILHLPSTITNLTILNQKNITDLTIAGYSNISTFRIENSSVDTKSMIKLIPTNARVRLIGFTWEMEDDDEIEEYLDIFDTMRGLDESGNNMVNAQISGTMHTTALTGSQIASYQERYPYLTVLADYTTSYLTYKSYDGATTLKTVECYNGEPQDTAPTIPVKSDSNDGHYSYTGIGWNTEMDSEVADPSAITNVITDRTVYAAYSKTVKTYTVTWKNGNTTIETDTNVPWGTVPTFNGTTPKDAYGNNSTGWEPTVAAITGDTVYTASFKPTYTATFVRNQADGGGTLYTQSGVLEGDTPVYSGSTPTTTKGSATDFEFIGWSPALAPISANTTYTAQFRDKRSIVVQYLMRTITNYESTTNTVKFGEYGFYNATSLETTTAPVALVEQYAFQNCSNLTTVDLSATSGAVTINANAFNGNSKLDAVIIRSSTMATLANTSAFTGTKIASKNGAIYVPSNMVDTYKANSNWANYIIASIDHYPITDFSTISDSWAEIIANNNYATDYKIGDTKMVDLGSMGKQYMELVAFDTDDKADGSGKARMTWILRDLLTTYAMNSSQKTVDGITSYTAGGWEHSDIRAWLKSDVKPLIPEVVRNAIVPVTKVSSTYTTSLVKDGQTTTDDVWIPGDREIFNNTNNETTGAVYSTRFASSSNRIKYNSAGSADSWWLRSANNADNFRSVNNGGNESGGYAYSSRGVVLGFCI